MEALVFVLKINCIMFISSFIVLMIPMAFGGFFFFAFAFTGIIYVIFSCLTSLFLAKVLLRNEKKYLRIFTILSAVWLGSVFVGYFFFLPVYSLPSILQGYPAPSVDSIGFLWWWMAIPLAIIYIATTGVWVLVRRYQDRNPDRPTPHLT